MSVNVTEYESTLWHDGLRIRILPNVLQRRDYFSGIYVYKSLNDQFPSYMSDLLHHVNEYNMYSTRNNVESKLYIPKPNIEIYRQSFQYAAPKFYNSLPTDITACTSLDQFKSNYVPHKETFPCMHVFRAACLAGYQGLAILIESK